MTWQSIVQALVMVVALAVTVPPLGRYIAVVYGSRGDGTAPRRPVLRPDRAVHLPDLPASTSDASSAGTSTPCRCWRSACCRCWALYALQRLQGGLPFNPTNHAAVAPFGAFNIAVSFVTNTNWQWYSRRADDEPPHPDARPRGAELRVGGGGHGGRRWRSSAASPAPAPRTLGNFWVDLTRTITAHPAADVARRSPWCSSRRASIQNFSVATPTRPRSTSDRRRGHDPVDPRRTGGVADGDQAARHQRRRLLQRQLGAPVREPERDHQLPRELRAPADPVRLRRDVRLRS